MRPRVRAVRLRSLVAASLLPVGIAWIPAQANGLPRPEPAEIALDIRNNAAFPVRCVVVLAHFVTRDMAEIAPGESRRLLLARDAATGTLAYGEHGGSPMFVENILCGATADWERHHAGLALDTLRVPSAVDYAATCGFDDGFRCAIVGATIGD